MIFVINPWRRNRQSFADFHDFEKIGDRANDVFVFLPNWIWGKITKLGRTLVAYLTTDPSTTFLHLTSTYDYLRLIVICRLENGSNVQQRLLANYEYVHVQYLQYLQYLWQICMHLKLLQVDGQSIRPNASMKIFMIYKVSSIDFNSVLLTDSTY